MKTIIKRITAFLIAMLMVIGSLQMPEAVYAEQTDTTTTGIETREPEGIEVQNILESPADTTPEIITETSDNNSSEINPETDETEPKIDETEPEIKETEPNIEETEQSEEPEGSEDISLESVADGVTVKIDAPAGTFPEDARLVVTVADAEEEMEAAGAVDEVRARDTNVAASYAFDIKVLDTEGNELQPAEGKNVNISFEFDHASDNNLTAEVYHIEESQETDPVTDVTDTVLVAEKLVSETDREASSVTAVTEGFSLYIVEFTYNSLSYVLDGGETVALSVILDTLGLTGSVEAVEVSDEELFSADNEGGEWIITSHKPFDSEEWMKVSIGGFEYVITVTDDGASIEVDSWTGLQNALDNGSNAGKTVKLLNDIECGNNNSIKVDGDNVSNITIDLSGHKMDRKRSSDTGDGHVINVKDGATLTITDSVGGGILTGGNATDGGGIKIEKNSTCKIESAIISGNKASKDGAGIYVWGKLVMTGGTITNNEAKDNGGGIYVENTGTLQLEDVTISENISKNGGGGLNIHVKDDNSYIKNCTISGNRSKESDGAGFSFDANNKKLVLENTEISHNTAKDEGGGIYIDAGTIEMTDGFISYNTSEDGGGVYNDEGTLNLSRVMVDYNSTTKYGGAGINNKKSATITECTISYNEAVAGGAGIYSGENITIQNCTIDHNRSRESGAGIRLVDCTATITGGSINNNTANNVGGGICIDSDAKAVLSGGLVVTENTAIIGGGGIWVGSSANIEIKDVLTITGNTVSDIYLLSGRKLKITGPLFDVNDETNKSRIGVILAEQQGIFTTGFAENNSDEDPYDYFIPESGCSLVLDENEVRVIASMWGYLQQMINYADNNAVINLDDNYKARSEDYTLTIPEGKNITINLKGHTLDRGLSSYRENGEVIIVRGNLTIEDTVGGGKICGGYGAGGGISVAEGGYLTLNKGIISGNNGKQKGGGILVLEGGTAVLNGGTIEKNSAPDGGGIYSAGNLTLESANPIKSNSGTNGGGIFVAGGTTVVKGTDITGNSANIGGGAYIAGGSLDLTDATITNNSAVLEAGGIWHGIEGAADAALKVQGAVNVSGNNSLTGNNTFLKNGRMITIGGVITGAALDLTTDDIDAKLTNGLSENTPAGSDPGDYAAGIFTYAGLGFDDALTVKDDGELYHKEITADVWVDSWDELQEKVNDNNNGHVIGLSRDLDGEGKYSIKVDGAKIESVTIELNGHKMDRKVIFPNNDGHAITVKNGAQLTITDSVGTGVITGGKGKDGGGIKIEENSHCTLRRVSIKGNEAEETGGGVYVGGTLTVDGGSITANAAGTCGGGIIVKDTGRIDLDNVIISDNSSGSRITNYSMHCGGGLYIELRKTSNDPDNADGTIKNSIIRNNTSKSDGGGFSILSYNRDLLVIDTEISGNTADFQAGGIYVGAGTVIMKGSNSRITGNKGKDAGGVMNSGGNIEFDGVTISDNNSTDESGGGVNNKSTGKLENCMFAGNRSGDTGGAVYNKHSGLSLTGCTFENNKAESKGGAVFSKESSTIENCSFISNKADKGGGVYLSKDTVFTENTMTQNTAESYGGAMYVESGDIRIDGGSITQNNAANRGSGIYADKEISIKGALTVQNNTKDNIYLNDKKINVNGTLTGAAIGVTLDDETGTFTKNYRSNNPATDPSYIFTSDVVGYSVVTDGDGEGKIVGSLWPMLQRQINETANTDSGSTDAPVLTLDKDWMAISSDTALTIPAGKRIVIDLNGHTLNMKRDSQKSNGQTFRVDSGCTLTIKDSSTGKTGKITGGWADDGGAVNLMSGATCNIEGGNFTGNRAGNGGAVYVHGGGTLNISGGSFNGNLATNGGAVYMADDGIATVSISGSVITGNEAAVEAGAVRVGENGVLNVSGNPFIKGNRGATGKNIFLGAGNVINITGDLTDESGTHIDLAAKSADSDNPGSGARLTNGLNDTLPAGNDIDDYAKSIFTYDETAFDNTLTVKDGELYHKDVEADVWVSSWAQLQAAIKNEAYKDKVIGLKNDIMASGSENRQLHNNGWTVTVELNGHTINRNRQQNDTDGHVFEIQNRSTLIIKDSVGTGVIKGGYASRGGGIHVGKDCTCRIEGGTVCGNKADVDGGGIYVRGTLVMTGGAVADNFADDTAGGIYCADTGTFDLTDVLISKNTSKNDGGGLIVHLSRDASITNCRIVNNISKTEDGGAMRMEAGNKTLFISNTDISGNWAENNGGAMVIYAGRIVMNGGTVSNNTSEDGGGVYNDDGTIEFTDVVIDGNTSYKKGGAGINNRNNATLTNCNIINNVGEKDGGGIYTTKPMTITGGTIYSNRAGGKGGGIYNGKDTTRITGTVFGYNWAGNDGGAIYAHDDMVLDNCTLDTNSTKKSGGGIRINDCDVTLSNCTIRGNTAEEYGGGVYINNGGADLKIQNGNITGNIAVIQGAGIYVNDDTDDVYISGDTGICDNIGTGDVYLTGDEILTIAGPLTSGNGGTSRARIGVITKNGTGWAFTNDYKEYNGTADPRDFFYSNEGYEAYLKDDKEVAFRKKEIVEDDTPFIKPDDQVERQWNGLNGRNWMSGLSGERYLNEINMPGTHDSGTKVMDGNANTSTIGKIMTFAYPLFGNALYRAVTNRFAKCQVRYIDEQLEDGVRRFDLRLINYYVNIEFKKDNGKDLWILHGKDSKTGTYFAKDHNGDWLTLAQVLTWYKDFLKENPSETIIVTMDPQGIDVDEDEVNARIKRHIRALTQEINPSTGEPYVYAEDGDYTKKFTRQPQLKDVRGKIIFDFDKGTGLSGGVLSNSGSFHDDAKTKIKNLTDFYNKYGFDDLPTNANFGEQSLNYYISVGTNGTDEPGDTPLGIADKVLPVLFGENGLLTNRIGKFIGLVNMDGVTSKIARQVWITNFFEGIEYCTVTSKASADDEHPKTYTVQKNTPITLPECIYGNPNDEGKYFQHWTDGEGAYYPDDKYMVTSDVTFTAVWEQADNSCIRAIWIDGDDADGTRPNKLQVTVTKRPQTDGEQTEQHSIILTADNKVWRKNLDYAVCDVEVTNPAGYTYAVQGTTIKLYHAPTKSVNASGSIEWYDNDDGEGKRPGEVTLNLYQDDEWKKSVIVKAENDWAYDLGNLALYKYDSAKNTVSKITYRLEQSEVEGYSTYVSGLITSGSPNEQGFDIINSLNTSMAMLEGAIMWVDDDDNEEKRPEKAKVRLLAGGAEKGSVDVSKNADDEWTFAFILDKEIPLGSYTVTEDPIDGYVPDIRMVDRNEDGINDAVVIINKLENHEHTIETFTETISEATCEGAGQCRRYEICLTCGEVISDITENIDPLGHDWGKWITKRTATETQTGLVERECKRNSEHVESHEPEPVAGKAATCTEAGSKAYYHCAGCGLNFLDPNDPENTKIDIEKGEAVIPALGHDWGEWETVKEATEKEEGQEIRKCKRDATHTETRSIPKIKHVHKPEPVAGKAATCTEAGSKAYYHCADCGLNFLDPNDPENTKIDIEKGEAVIPALGHDWGKWVTVKEATEKEEGQEIRKCKRDATHTETRQVEKKDPGKVSYTVTVGDNQIWYKGTINTVVFKFKRSYDDETTFSHFTGIKIDGKNVAENNYTKAPGSIIIRLNPDYLSLLKVGTHTLVAEFDDGSADASFTVADRDANNNSSSSGSSNSSSSSGSNNSSSGSGSSNSSDILRSSNSSDILRNSNPIIPDTGNADNSNGSIGLNTGSSKMKGVNSVDKSMKGENRNVPITGDSGTVIIWFALLFASLTVLVLVVRAGRKKSI